jgi:hypothetical protein
VRIKWFILGAVFFSACGVANIQFPYKWFYASPIAVWEFPAGKLLGAKPEDDKLLSDCKPTQAADGKLVQKCAVVFLDELEKLIVDYKQTKQRVIDLEKRCQNSLSSIEK